MIDFMFNIFKSIENYGVNNSYIQNIKEINSIEKVLIIDGDSIGNKTFKKIVNEIGQLDNIKVYFVKFGNANKTIKKYAKNNPQKLEVIELHRYRRGKEVVDKFICLMLPNIIKESDNVVIISNDGDFVDIIRMLEMSIEKQINFTICYTEEQKVKHFSSINVPRLGLKKVNLSIEKLL